MTTRKPALTIDFDDVIVYFFREFLPWCAKENGTSLRYENMHDYGDHTLLHHDGDATRDWINHFAEHHQHTCPPVEGAIHNIKYLSTYFVLHLVTSRPAYLEPVVRDWLGRHGIIRLFASLTFTNSFGNDPHAPRTDKPTVCRQLGAVAHIDDAVNHAMAVGEIGIPVYMLSRPWNIGKIPESAVLAKNWGVITQHLLSQNTT